MTERLHFDFSLSCAGEGNGNPLQCSCLENPRDGGAWWAAISDRTELDTTEATQQQQQQQLFPSGGQSIRTSASISPVNTQDRFPLGLTCLIFLLSKGLSRVFSNTTVQKYQFFSSQPSLWINPVYYICLKLYGRKSSGRYWQESDWVLSMLGAEP